MADGTIQVAPDSTGKRIANFALKLPAGTVVLDGDGVQSALGADTTVFVQRVALTDSSGRAIDTLVDTDWQGQLLAEMRAVRLALGQLIEHFGGDALLNLEETEQEF